MSEEKKINLSSSDKPSPKEESGAEEKAPAGPETGGGQTAQAAEEKQSEAEALKQQICELTDRLQRAMAEQDNMRKRLEREKEEIAKYAVSNFARDVLTVADNIQRAIDAVPRDAAERDPALKSFLEGVEVTERELLKVMERYGIQRLNPEGEKFDPNFHQAMFEVATPDMPNGTIVQVVQPGYMLGERVLRPALVGVAKATPKSSDAGPGADQKPDQGAADNESGGGDPANSPATSEREEGKALHRTDAPQPEEPETSKPKGEPQQRASRLSEPVIGPEETRASKEKPEPGPNQRMNKTA